jgi:hypothetical protein
MQVKGVQAPRQVFPTREIQASHLCPRRALPCEAQGFMMMINNDINITQFDIIGVMGTMMIKTDKSSALIIEHKQSLGDRAVP